MSLEEAPHPELRVLPMVYANLSRIAPTLALPSKLRGNSRATFTFNRLISHEALPALKALSAALPVILAKGAVFCVRFNAWAARQTGDIDVHVPQSKLAGAVDILSSLGWTPKYGMTSKALVYRTALRRNSWNFARNRGDIDLHWRFLDGADKKKVARSFWESAEQVNFLGVRVLAPSPEFSLVGALQHGFAEGTRSDALQAIIDCWHWLPLCNAGRLEKLLSLSETAHLVERLRKALYDAKLPLERITAKVPAPPHSSRAVRARPITIRRDELVLRHPLLYALWERLGRRCLIERHILRCFGPFSKPPNGPPPFRTSYDLRDCAVVDEIGGPGWGWPEPEHTCFWSDQADNRLLVAIPDLRDYTAVFSVSPAAKGSPNAKVRIVVNGRLIRILRLRSEDANDFKIPIPRSALLGRWIEFSFRPTRFDKRPILHYARRRSLPAVRLQILPAEEVDLVRAREQVAARS